ncbi:unnamed protein product [Durusdinium trenchii]|uniref:S1 motif domain-containing protein n=1 Tax=Durusdinium trenchii TaxID=1381693 RepID=A0ABP0NPJ8_9DINO
MGPWKMSLPWLLLLFASTLVHAQSPGRAGFGELPRQPARRNFDGPGTPWNAPLPAAAPLPTYPTGIWPPAYVQSEELRPHPWAQQQQARHQQMQASAQPHHVHQRSLSPTPTSAPLTPAHLGWPGLSGPGSAQIPVTRPGDQSIGGGPGGPGGLGGFGGFAQHHVPVREPHGGMLQKEAGASSKQGDRGGVEGAGASPQVYNTWALAVGAVLFLLVLQRRSDQKVLGGAKMMSQAAKLKAWLERSSSTSRSAGRGPPPQPTGASHGHARVPHGVEEPTKEAVPVKVAKVEEVDLKEPEAEAEHVEVERSAEVKEAMVEMDGRLMSIDQLCEEVGARRVAAVASPGSEASPGPTGPAGDPIELPAPAPSRSRVWRGRQASSPAPISAAEVAGPPLTGTALEERDVPALAACREEEAVHHSEPSSGSPRRELQHHLSAVREVRTEVWEALSARPPEDDWSWGAGEPKAARDGCIYFAGGPPPLRRPPAVGVARSGRSWCAGGAGRSSAVSVASSKAAVSDDELLELETQLEDGKFIMAKALRYRPTGCFLRLPGGREGFLPVEHMVPRTEANTNAVRKTVTAAMDASGRLAVRELGAERATMLKRREEVLKSEDLDARRRKMEERIDQLKENYSPNKLMVGFVSSVQKNGIFVSVIDGLDALIPIKELPAKFLVPAESPEASKGQMKPSLEVGQAVQFRLIRYSYQSDGFTASMLPPENRTRPARQRPTGGFEEELERPPSPDNSALGKAWAAKGYSAVSTEAAAELNEWLRSKMEDKKSKKGSKSAVKSTQNTYLVSILRGMNTKAVGSIDLEKNISEKEIKQAAVDLLQKQGHLKAGEQHKGVTITKNIINVKL